MKNYKALKRAIDNSGGITKTAEKLGISKQAVCSWKACPPHHAIELEKISGVSRYELRPDIYGRAP